MKLFSSFTIFLVIFKFSYGHPSNSNVINGDSIKPKATEVEMKAILEEYNTKAKTFCNPNALANWAVQTDVGNQENEAKYQETSLNYANFQKEQWEQNFKNSKEDDYVDENVKRQIKSLRTIGTSRLEDDDLKNLNAARVRMSNIYNSAKICPFTDKSCASPSWTLDNEIYDRMEKSRDYEELEYVFNEWHDKSGKLMKTDYAEYVSLMNKAAKLNDFADAGEMWTAVYDEPKFKEIIDELWNEVQPLYNDLHKYVKSKLLKMYPDKLDKNSQNIPAHILGNMWAQTWENLYEDIKPFKDASSIDVTSKMEELKYDAYKMFEVSNEFYMSMGLENNSMSYQVPPALIEKPEDKIVACHASAWDFCDETDFRIKMCTQVNMHDFLVVHHEMGHIQYYLQYKDKPLTLRGGANPGFHEAVGDTIALSVSTPQHLKKVGLLDSYADSNEDNINALFKMALQRVAFLPFGLLIDKWRWEVFSGSVEEKNWNSRWWELRDYYQKVSPPSIRNDAEFFDPGAKYHIPASSQYISYFVAHILEFQFYRSLCIAAGQYDPTNEKSELHKCDFYQSTAAGDKLKAGLALGATKPWPDALEAITGEKKISAAALLEYFRPLRKFFQEERAKEALEFLDAYNKEAPNQCNIMVTAEWAYNTDISNETKQENLIKKTAEYAIFAKDQALAFRNYDPDEFEDELTKRQVRQIKKLGTAALSAEDLDTFTKTVSDMEVVYNTATLCPYKNDNCDKPWTLDPELSERLAYSDDYDELLYIWKNWRDESGKKMRESYKTYVEMGNKAAVENGYDDYGEMWREMYEDDNFIANIDRMWGEVKELYDELHKYVGKKLKGLYGEKYTRTDGLIPAHLLGNMWAQSWVNLYDRIKPFSNGSLIDVTEAIKNKYTVLEMFQEADKFYKELGLEPNDMSYGDLAVIEKPIQPIVCHASAWDFCDQKDFRIKMCTSLNMEDFVTIHHEMGHIQYYILYKNQPIALREGANPGFHEAVGDLIALSVSSPTHLSKIGLLTDYADSYEDNINALFQMALERVAFLPFGLLIDKWRWDVFSKTIPETEWNKHWWYLRETYQKVAAPVERSETDFDPGAKYHVAADSKYISYFIAHILEFQLHRAVCREAGQYVPNDPTKPLHKCDIAGSEKAGAKIRAGLELGLSRHWSVALEKMTGETVISGASLIEYFAPLLKFLKEQNKSEIEPLPVPEEKKGKKNVGAIVGGVVGGAAAVGIIGYGIYYFNKK